MTRRAWWATLAAWGVVAMTGCGSDAGPAARSEATVESTRSDVQQAMREVVEVASGVGVDVPAASASWSVCSSDPPRLKYGAGGAGTPAGAPAPEAIAALTSSLADAGWAVDDSGTDPEPYAVLTRDDLRLSLGESRREPGAVSLGVTGPCVATTQEQDSLLGERDDVL